MDIAIVGVGHTPPARRSPKSIRHLAIEAIQLALDDAGLDAADIDGVITDGVIMPPTVPREFIAAQFGMTRSFDGGVSFGGAGVASAPELAKLAIGAGKARTVLFYFGVDWGSRASGPTASTTCTRPRWRSRSPMASMPSPATSRCGRAVTCTSTA
ncbi:MAG: hypothetical protein IPG43_05730 [Proteobacteria bacterium]|nr:hypothetical protein [Pseudomonadota bacterium]